MLNIRNTYMPFNDHQVNMVNVWNHAYTLHLQGLWDDEEYMIINAYIEGVIELENAPMPSAFKFLSPLSWSSQEDRWVYFTELCYDIEADYRLVTTQPENHIFDVDYNDEDTISVSDWSGFTDITDEDGMFDI